MNNGGLFPEINICEKRRKLQKSYGKINKFNNIKQQGIF